MRLPRSPVIFGALWLSVALVPAALMVRFYGQEDQPQTAAAAPAAVGDPAPRSAPPALVPTAAPSPSMPFDEAQRTYAAANLFADCEQRARDTTEGSGAADEAYQIDASGALAAQLEHGRNARRAQCRLVGPAEYRQIDRLLELAAAHGQRDAQGLLLRRRAQALLARTQPDAGTAGTAGADKARTFDASDEREARAITSGLEALALAGHRESMVALVQWLSSPQPSLANPTRAAAWSLVSNQTFATPFPARDQLPGAGILVDMDSADSQTVVTLAKSLFESCCAR